MKKLLLFIFTITAAVCNGQTAAQTLVISRSEAIKIGLQNRFDVKANQFDIQIAESKVKQAKNNWFPDIGTDGSIRYSPQLQNSVIPGGVFPGFDQTLQLPLMVRNESVFGLNLNQPVFNTNLINDTKLAKNQLALQQEKNRGAEINIMLQISQAYLDVELRELQKRIASDIAARNTEYALIAEGMYKNGSLIENYYLRAKLDRENAEQLQKQAEQNYALSLMQLRYQLNVPDGTPLKTSDSLDAVNEDQSILDKQAGERTEIRQLQLLQQEDRLNLKKVEQSVLPSVFLGANYSQQYLSNNFKYMDGRWWSPFSYVTLNIHIPISAHFKNKAITTEYRQQISQSELLLDQKKADINYEVEQARTSLSNAILNMKSKRNSYKLSKNIFHNQQQQYRLGAFDYSALLDTEKSLSTTERSYIQGAYDLILAQIKLQKATNNFNIN